MNGYKIISEAMDQSQYSIIPLDKNLFAKFHKQFSYNMKKSQGKKEYDDRIIIDNNTQNWIGYISYHKEYEMIDVLEVNKKYQRQGYASILIELYPQAKMLFASIANKKARPFYTKHGWVDSGIRQLHELDKTRFRVMLYTKIDPFKFTSKGVIVNLPILYPNCSVLAYTKIKETGDPKKDYSKTKIGELVQHSDKPNMRLIQIRKRFFYESVRFIKKGETITI